MAPGRDAAGATMPVILRRRSGAKLLRVRVTAFVAALVVCTLGLLHATGHLPAALHPDWLPRADTLWRYDAILAATGVNALAQLLLLWIRTGSTKLGFAWGEAAVILSCYWLPAGFVPAVVLAGVLTARTVQIAVGRYTGVMRALANAASLSVAAAVAAAVALLGGVEPNHQLRVGTAVALAASGVVYSVVSASIVAAHVVADHADLRYRQVLQQMATSKAPMALGNIVISISALAAIGHMHWWLLVLPPIMWLLHQTYTYRLRAEDERRTWQVFAETTRHLNHLDERHAAVAGLRGLQRLFHVDAAEIVIDGPPGASRAYLLAPSGVLTRTEPPALPATPPAANRPLLVGGARIGELRLRRDGHLNRREHLVLAAYGDALAAALHDAVTNTELRTLSERSTYDAIHDGLTGLANRASLLVHGTAALQALEPGAPVALLLLDVDDFKNVNTTLGLAAGDELLRRAAGRLADLTRPGELLARLGGDEFALLVTGDGADLTGALARARRLTEELAVPIEVAGVLLSVEASVGVVAAAAGGVDMTELLRRADIAMYQAKHEGSSVAWYDPDRDVASTDRLALLAELREALGGRGQLDVLMQPSVALDSGRAVGVEAFVRWQHPRRGTLKPVDFVRVVEQSELLGQFTRYVLDRALAVAGQLAVHGLVLPVSVNLSPRSLHDRELASDVANLLRHHGVPAERLVLEITETVVLSSHRVVDDVLGDLRDLGVQLAVDDFGTGCSALTFLTRVPIDEVKIDRTFVTRMVDSPEAAAIVRTTVELARELGLRVVAEGVESAEQRKALLGLGCPAAQGFHFYPLMTPERLVEALRADAAKATPVRRLRAAE